MHLIVLGICVKDAFRDNGKSLTAAWPPTLEIRYIRTILAEARMVLDS